MSFPLSSHDHLPSHPFTSSSLIFHPSLIKTPGHSYYLPRLCKNGNISMPPTHANVPRSDLFSYLCLFSPQPWETHCDTSCGQSQVLRFSATFPRANPNRSRKAVHLSLLSMNSLSVSSYFPAFVLYVSHLRLFVFFKFVPS